MPRSRKHPEDNMESMVPPDPHADVAGFFAGIDAIPEE